MKTGQTILEQAKAVLLKSRNLSQDTKVRLIYKRVDFLGTANLVFEKLLRVIHTFLSALRT